MRNIVLVGFMGTGKSTTGRHLAKMLHFRLIDVDRAIENEYGMTIPEMFTEYGEEYFRACESQMVKKMSGWSNVIIATGGGTVKNPDNVAMLKSNGYIFCLTADTDTLLVRTGRRGRRPVLDKLEDELGDRRKAIEALVDERRRLYSRAADFIMNTSNKTPPQVANEIIDQMKRVEGRRFTNKKRRG